MIDIGERLRGGGFDSDLVPEGFELVDESAFACFGAVEAAGEVVRAQVAVGGSLGQDVPDDHNEGVGGGGLLTALAAEAAVEAAELRAHVGTGPTGGPGALGEQRAEFLAALAGPTRAVLAGGFVVARAQSGPRGQVRRGGESGHVDADLGDDDLSGALTDPGDGRQRRRLSDEREAGLIDAGVRRAIMSAR